MDVLGDVIARDRRSPATALDAPAVERSYDYHRFCTTAWKVGNFLRYLGVRSGAGVAVADEPLPEPVLSLFGAGLLGGVVRFDPSECVDDDRVLVVPTDRLHDYEVGPSTKRVVYGSRPDDPSVSYFERDVWSENPTMPPDRVSPDDPVLATPDRTYSHGELVRAAERTIAALEIEADTEIAVKGSLAEPGVVAAGIIAPLVAGATASLRPGSGSKADYVVGGPDSDVDPAAVFDR